MAKLTKKQKSQADTVDREKLYGVDEALKLVKTNATAKFDETIEAVSYTHLTLPTTERG